MEGIIVIDKPKGITSFDVIRKLRKILKEKRIGHTGTLDPLATGILVICVGRATKLAQDIEGYDKEYIAEFELGYQTDTYDIEGTVVKSVEKFDISKEMLESVINNYIGDIKQVPPMYSAIKIDGKKLYELARQGIEVERKPRDVKISSIVLEEFDGKKVKIRCRVSKGTYIRSLIDDIGKDLEVYATMTNLRRTVVGDNQILESYTLDDLTHKVEQDDYNFLVPIEKYFNYTDVEITNEKDLNLFLNGQRSRTKVEDGRYRVYYNSKFMGLGEVKQQLLKGYKYY